MNSDTSELDLDSEDAPSNAGQSLPRLLHAIGSLVVVAALSVFLFQQWSTGNDLGRYALLLSVTLSLTAAGFLSGHWLKEGRGARLLIGLALGAIPVNFAILGGLSFPYLGWEAVSGALPGYAAWDAGSTTAAWATLIGAGLALGVAARVGFMVLARRSATPLSALYALGNLALLVPTRDATVVSGLLVALTLALLAVTPRLARRDMALATPEGVFARLLLVLPLLVIAGRSLLLYEPGAALMCTLALSAYALIRAIRTQSGMTSVPHWPGEAASVAAALWCVLAAGELMVAHWHTLWQLILVAALAAALALDMAALAPHRAWAYRLLASALLVGTGALNLLFEPGLPAALGCLAVALGMTAWGYRLRMRGILAMGGLGTLFSLAVAVSEAVTHYSVGGWLGLAMIGVLTIVSGSLVERYGERLRYLLERRLRGPG